LCAWSAWVCFSSGRSRTSCTLSAEAITSTSSSAPRCCASSIMRPTRGSSGRRPALADAGELVGVVHRAQFGQQLVAVGDGAALRRLQEREVLHRAQVQRLHAQDHARQRAAQDFGVGEARPAVEAGLVVQADADAVGHAAAAAGALVGRRLADGLDQQLLHLAAEAVALDARRAGVDDVADARHRQRGFGHVGGQHDAALAVRLEDAVLLGLRQARKQRQHLGVAQRRLVAQVLAQVVGGFADLALAGQEDQDVAARAPTAPQLVHAIGDGVVQVVLAALFKRPVAHLHREGAARDHEHRRRPLADAK
jgi:hypothetical protein